MSVEKGESNETVQRNACRVRMAWRHAGNAAAARRRLFIFVAFPGFRNGALTPSFFRISVCAPFWVAAYTTALRHRLLYSWPLLWLLRVATLWRQRSSHFCILLC